MMFYLNSFSVSTKILNLNLVRWLLICLKGTDNYSVQSVFLVLMTNQDCVMKPVQLFSIVVTGTERTSQGNFQGSTLA